MTESRPAGASPAKREAILDAALGCIARTGLHNTPMSAIAREAGVAAGTSYLYFPSKEELINALYLRVVGERERATQAAPVPAESPREAFRRFWLAYARWHLENRDAANFVQQCEASAILTEETRERQGAARRAGLERFAAEVRRGVFRDLPVEIFFALFAGPVLVLSQLRDRGEIEGTEAELRLAFEGVCRAVLPAEG